MIEDLDTLPAMPDDYGNEGKSGQVRMLDEHGKIRWTDAPPTLEERVRRLEIAVQELRGWASWA